jgi:hypothetical protein
MGMEMPLQWHRRQAIVLASQLPDNSTDALMVVQALKELVDNYLVANDPSLEEPRRLSGNVLPFTG